MSTDAFHDSPEINEMSQVSIDLSARARKGYTRLLRSLESSNEAQLAAALGMDGSSLSRLKNDKRQNGLTNLETFCGILEALGLKVVPQEMQCFSRERVEALFVLSKGWMNRAHTVDDLFQDELGDREDLDH